MSSPEGRPRPPVKREMNPLLAGVIATSLTSSPMTFTNVSQVDCDYNEGIPYITQDLPLNTTLEELCPPLERAQGQRFGTFYYGHREPAMIMKEGNIADGFIPVNGEEYGEEDVKLIYAQLEKMKYAHLDYILMSWHTRGDVRDRFMKFMLDVMKRPDNPYKTLQIGEIYEKESNLYQIPQTELEEDITHQKENYWNDPHFLKDESGRPIVYVYAQSMEGWLDNPNYAKQWYEAGEKFGFTPVLEAYIGYKRNPYYEKLKWFNYAAGNIWEIFPPSTSVTKDRFRYTEEYSKIGNQYQSSDFKKLEFVPDRFREDLEKAIRSGLTSDATAWNEEFEHADIGNNEEALEIMHDNIPAQPAPPPEAVTGYEYIVHVMHEQNKIIEIEIPPALPPAEPKEHPLFAMEARRKKEDELGKPKQKPNFKPKTKAA